MPFDAGGADDEKAFLFHPVSCFWVCSSCCHAGLCTTAFSLPWLVFFTLVTSHRCAPATFYLRTFVAAASLDARFTRHACRNLDSDVFSTILLFSPSRLLALCQLLLCEPFPICAAVALRIL